MQFMHPPPTHSSNIITSTCCNQWLDNSYSKSLGLEWEITFFQQIECLILIAIYSNLLRKLENYILTILKLCFIMTYIIWLHLISNSYNRLLGYKNRYSLFLHKFTKWKKKVLSLLTPCIITCSIYMNLEKNSKYSSNRV